jgi:RHS repeat-associated protein
MQLTEIRQISETGQISQIESLVYDTRYLHSVACRDILTPDSSLLARYFPINDANFNVTSLISTNGAVVERYTYDPYGNVTFRTGDWNPITWDSSTKNIILYIGHKFDSETGFYYSLYRYYHPILGRWLTRDPLAETRDNLALRGVSGKMMLQGKQSINKTDENVYNLSEYASNNPILFVDTLGLISSSSGSWSPTVVWAGDGFYWLYQGYWTGKPYWDTNPAGGPGGTKKWDVDLIMMKMSPCNNQTGCFQLDLYKAYGNVTMWYRLLFPNAHMHEMGHINLWHERFLSSKNYAINLQHCYCSKAKAMCWKKIAEKEKPIVDYWQGIINNLGYDLITSGPDWNTANLGLSAAQSQLWTAETACTAMGCL